MKQYKVLLLHVLCMPITMLKGMEEIQKVPYCLNSYRHNEQERLMFEQFKGEFRILTEKHKLATLQEVKNKPINPKKTTSFLEWCNKKNQPINKGVL